jgi:hypothetical protein
LSVYAYPFSSNVRKYQRNKMYFHGILLAMMNVVNADTNYFQWSYIEIPSHWNASSAQTTLLCAFKMFRSNYAQVSNGSSKCTLNYNLDTVLPEYTDYNNYKELIQFKDFRPLVSFCST